MKRVIGLYKGELDELKSNLGRFRLRDSGGLAAGISSGLFCA